MDTQALTLGTMVDRLESRGQWKIELDINELLRGDWAKALEIRSNYLKDARGILLQDL
jgi:membrane protein